MGFSWDSDGFSWDFHGFWGNPNFESVSFLMELEYSSTIWCTGACWLAWLKRYSKSYRFVLECGVWIHLSVARNMIQFISTTGTVVFHWAQMGTGWTRQAVSKLWFLHTTGSNREKMQTTTQQLANNSTSTQKSSQKLSKNSEELCLCLPFQKNSARTTGVSRHLQLFGRSSCRKRDAKSLKRSSELDQTMNSISPPERAMVTYGFPVVDSMVSPWFYSMINPW